MTELLTVYDESLQPMGDYTREEVHANELLHQTVRLWVVQGDCIWFQRRSKRVKLFTGRLDVTVTGHIHAGESPREAVLRETLEEIGLFIDLDSLEKIGEVSLKFLRPDGKIDNEHANVFIYKIKDTPCFCIGDEVQEMGTITVADYDRLLRDGDYIPVVSYRCGHAGETSTCISTTASGSRDFCCLNEEEWELVKNVL